MDFTLRQYIFLLDILKEKGYQFVTFFDYCKHKIEFARSRYVVLRHDVDLRAENALKVAIILKETFIQKIMM